jgi:hypothetical protein
MNSAFGPSSPRKNAGKTPFSDSRIRAHAFVYAMVHLRQRSSRPRTSRIRRSSRFFRGPQNPPGWSSEKSKNRDASVDVAVLDLDALSDSVPELEEIDKRFAAAPDRGFRGRAVSEYGTIQRLVKSHVDLDVARILDFCAG